MDIKVSGHQVDTGDALRTHVNARIEGMTQKYLSRAIATNVTFGRGPYEDFTCDILSPVAHGVVLKASNRAGDAHVAFEGAADKIEKQLRRYNERLRDRRGASDDVGLAEIPSNAGYTVFAAAQDEETPLPPSPAIIAETRVDIPEASVGDAAMMLDLRNTNALIFKNAKTGVLNMIYRRGDGTIGWVEPAGA